MVPTDDLRVEITTDPRSQNFVGMTDVEVVANLKTANIECEVATVTGQEVFEAADPTELAALSSDNKIIFMGIVGMGTIQVNGSNTRASLAGIFLVGSTTRANLLVLQTEIVSWADLNWPGELTNGHIEAARL